VLVVQDAEDLFKVSFEIVVVGGEFIGLAVVADLGKAFGGKGDHGPGFGPVIDLAGIPVPHCGLDHMVGVAKRTGIGLDGAVAGGVGIFFDGYGYVGANDLDRDLQASIIGFAGFFVAGKFKRFPFQ